VGSGYYNNVFGLTYLNEQNKSNGTTQYQQRSNALASEYTKYIDMIVSEAHRDFSSITVNVPLDLQVRGVHPNGTYTWISYLGKARAMVSKAPGFLFSSYRSTAWIAPVLISMNDFQRICTEVIANATLTPSSPPKQRVLVKLVPGATKSQREDVINGLRTYFVSDKTITFDTQTLIETLHTSVDMMTLFFQIVSIISMTLCFFILWLSFTANVRENAWEFGVLRAIGLSGYSVVCTYVYEALTLVYSSLILGTIIGLLISASLTLQFNLFTQMPFRMTFPIGLFFSLMGMSTGVAILGSYLPAREFLKTPISSTIRRT